MEKLKKTECNKFSDQSITKSAIIILPKFTFLLWMHFKKHFFFFLRLFSIISYSTEQCFEHNTQPLSWHSKILADQLTLSKDIHLPHYYLPLRIFKLSDGSAETFDNVSTNLLYFSEMLRSWNRGKLSNNGVVSPWWFFVTRWIASKVWSPTIYGIQRSCFGVNKLQVNNMNFF